MNMFVFESSASAQERVKHLKRFVSSLFMIILFSSLQSAFAFGSSKAEKIRKLVEEGSVNEMKSAFKTYDYLNNTTIGSDKDTLLMHAIEFDRDVNFIKLLLKGDVKLKKKNKQKQDALFYICRFSDDNDKVFSFILSKWGRKAAVSRGLLRKDKSGLTAYEYALDKLSEERISELENYLDPLKSQEIKEKYREEHGLPPLVSLDNKESKDEKKSAEPEKKASSKEEKTKNSKNKKTDKSKQAEVSSEENNEDGKDANLSENGENKNEENAGSVEKSEAESGENEETSENEEGSSQEEKSLQEGKKSSIDIDKKQAEIESLYGKNGKAGDNSKTFLFDYQPEFEDVEPEDNSSKEISLAVIKNPNSRDFNGRTLLMRSVRDGNDWEVKSLIASGADINLCDNEGWTALMFAVRYQNNVEIVKLLLENGADLYAVNRYGSTPLLLASCYSANPEILKTVLTAYKGGQNDIFKAFILTITSNSGNYASQLAKLQIFIDRGISMNRFYEGKTPLMYACEYAGTTKVIKLLLDYGAVYTIRDAGGKKAFDYAKQNNKLERDEVYWLLNGN